jgi:CspA family cold shock protein
LRGTVKWFNDRMGHGLLLSGDFSKAVFVHHSGIQGEGVKTLNAGDAVEFVLAPDGKGLKAVDVVRV